MELQNFKIVTAENQQIIELSIDNKIYDLHNCAEFKSFLFDIELSIVCLTWINYNYTETSNQLNINFENIGSVSVTERDDEMPCEEDRCLEEIVLTDVIKFKFRGGTIITILAKRAYVHFR